MKTKLMARELCWKHLGIKTSLTVGNDEYKGMLCGITQLHFGTKRTVLYILTNEYMKAVPLTCGHEITLWEEQ